MVSVWINDGAATQMKIVHKWLTLPILNKNRMNVIIQFEKQQSYSLSQR